MQEEATKEGGWLRKTNHQLYFDTFTAEQAFWRNTRHDCRIKCCILIWLVKLPLSNLSNSLLFARLVKMVRWLMLCVPPCRLILRSSRRWNYGQIGTLKVPWTDAKDFVARYLCTFLLLHHPHLPDIIILFPAQVLGESLVKPSKIHVESCNLSCTACPLWSGRQNAISLKSLSNPHFDSWNYCLAWNAFRLGKAWNILHPVWCL